MRLSLITTPRPIALALFAAALAPTIFAANAASQGSAAAASRPQRDGEWGLANFSSIHGRIASAASGATGVVAW